MGGRNLHRRHHSITEATVVWIDQRFTHRQLQSHSARDGHAVELIADRSEVVEQRADLNGTGEEKLWFVNLGGYDSDSLQELHQFGLVVAHSKQAAKARARRRWLKDALNVHKDDLHSINNLGTVDDCLPLFNIDGWHIHLRPQSEHPDSDLKPDWFGYWRIDGRHPKPRPD